MRSTPKNLSVPSSRVSRALSRRPLLASWLAFPLMSFAGCTAAHHGDGDGSGEEYSGGETTVFDASEQAFTYPAQNLSSERRRTFYFGNNLFNDNWVTAPASTEGRDGLGPTFNAQSCSGCHFKDGRGAPPTSPSEPLQGLLFRLSVPGVGEHGGVIGDPVYGDQFNPYAIQGVPAEGKVEITYQELPGYFADGSAYSLRAPTYSFHSMAYGPLAEDIQISPRVAPGMIGLGLLEAIEASVLRSLEDPDDADGDGISGRLNTVWDERLQTYTVGRFGWKANQPGLEQQNAGAFLGDMGITSPLFPSENCPPSQRECTEALTGGAPELDDAGLEAVTYYSRTLAVPARRDWTHAEVRRGKALFQEANCASCHVPQFVTGEVPAFPELSHQTFYPYTDLLLHDMGEALADHRPDHDASGTEWRTPPLWGIGLVETVNHHTYFLHDGRARNLTEAILWHGGEAEASKEHFRSMSVQDRAALLRFLNSL